VSILGRLFGKKPKPTDPEQLLQTVAAFIQARTWTESQRVAAGHPELLNDEADALLAQLAQAQESAGARQAVEEHRALLHRCREVGIEAAFAEKVGAGGEGLPIPPEFRADLQQANEAEERYLRSGDRAALDAAAAAAGGRILAHPAFPAAPERFQLAALNNAGGVLLRRYWATGRLADLNQALGCWQQAVERTPPDSPDLPMYLNNLGNGLSDRYARSGDLADLAEAVRVYQQAVERTPPDSPDLPMYLNNLGNGLSDRYARSGDLADLAEAVRDFQQAVERTPPDSPDLPGYLNNLGNGLSDRYARSGDLADLAEAVRDFQQAGLAWLRLADVQGDRRHTLLVRAADVFYRVAASSDVLAVDPLLQARIRYGLGRCYYQLGRWREAIELLEQARETFSRRKVRPELASTLLELGQLYQATQDFESAYVYLKDAWRLFRRMNDLNGIAVTQEALGSLALQTARPAEAIAALQEARQGYTALRRPDRIREVDDLLHIAHQARRPAVEKGATP